MNILFLTRRFWPDIGGVEKHVLELGKRLVEKGYEVTVVTESQGKRNEIEGIKIVRINGGKEHWFKKFRIWKGLFKNISLISSSDIVHCHDVFFWYLPFKFIFPLKKVYTTFHGYEGNNIPGKKAIFMHKLAEILSNGNICIGKFLEKWYGTKATFITYGAIDEKILELQTSNSKDIVFAGRLVEETGIMKYLEALKILKDKNYNLRFNVYGEGNLRKKAESFARKHNIKVNFYGFKNDIEKHVKDYKCVFASRYLGILEALALKKIVIAEYNNEIKKDYLYMTPFAKYIFIAQTSREIAGELEKYVMGSKNFDEKSYEWVKNQTWENLTSQYLNLWNRR